MEQINSSSGWCILRTAGPATLTVVEALREEGYDAWTPVEVLKRRIGRKREIRETSLAITPGFAFAREDRLADLICLSRSPALTYQKWNSDTQRMETRGCPYFSVFRTNGQYARVTDRALDPLRVAEQRSRPRPKTIPFEEGTPVRCPGSGFDGLIGTVVETERRYVLVEFTGFPIPVKIDAQYVVAHREAA
ncbi:MAG TPA: hypothetical protein VF503_09050 [Sphingobium sp.]|uniref:hypothetical protein n=1 Tax=Sphingobium sp. TaxID=1912891 RepID=UPI002ED2BE15